MVEKAKRKTAKKPSGGGARANTGDQTQYVPTEKDRDIVRRAVKVGLPRDRISYLVVNPKTKKAISSATLYQHFRREIDLGVEEMLLDCMECLEGAVHNGDVSIALKILQSRGGPLWNPAINYNINAEVTHKYDDLPRNKRLHLIAAILDSGGTGKTPRLVNGEAAGDAGRSDLERDRVIDLAPSAWTAEDGSGE